MEFYTNIISIIWTIIIIGTIVMLWRNNKVHKENIRVINIIFDLANKDIENKIDWKWRYTEFDTVSYTKILFMFWKPIKSFYANLNCIK